MSIQLHEIETLRGQLQITQFAGPSGMALQLTQGFSNGPDEPGYVQLSMSDVACIVPLMVKWMQDESHRKAELLRQKIAEDTILERTIFSESVACEKFIADFAVPKFSVTMLAKIQ